MHENLFRGVLPQPDSESGRQADCHCHSIHEIKPEHGAQSSKVDEAHNRYCYYLGQDRATPVRHRAPYALGIASAGEGVHGHGESQPDQDRKEGCLYVAAAPQQKRRQRNEETQDGIHEERANADKDGFPCTGRVFMNDVPGRVAETKETHFGDSCSCPQAEQHVRQLVHYNTGERKQRDDLASKH